MGAALKCGIVESFVDLVEKVGVALVLGSGEIVLGSVGVMLCRWWVVENYIWVLLLLCIVQSPRFTNSQYAIGEIFKCCACASCTIQ
jgi:hypothetical protein